MSDKRRAIVTVNGGVAEVMTDEDGEVDVYIFDFDDLEQRLDEVRDMAHRMVDAVRDDDLPDFVEKLVDLI